MERRRVTFLIEFSFAYARGLFQLHEQDEALNMFSPDVPPVPPAVALRQFGYAVLGFAGFFTLLNYVKPDPPMLRRVYPHDGLVKELGGLEANKVRTKLAFDIAPDHSSRVALSLSKMNRYYAEQADPEWTFFPLIEDLNVQFQQNVQALLFLFVL